MSFAASVVTTFPSAAFELYGRAMLQSFTANWPAQIPILCFLDDDTIAGEAEKLLRPQDAIAIHKNKDRQAFLERNAGKDAPDNYRKQALRFCHKVFALKDASDYWKNSKDEKKARYLIWMDADVLTTRPVSLEEISRCLPEQGACVSYLGRKDWDHSECGWLAFDLQNGGHDFIDKWVEIYTSDEVFHYEQWHDSWLFDRLLAQYVLDDVANYRDKTNFTNLTRNRDGMEIWPQSPMAAWSRHYKGPIAKQELAPSQSQIRTPGVNPKTNIKIETKNSLPHETIRAQIEENQAQIKHWLTDCTKTDEEIVVVSAGPQLVAEDLYEEVKAGRRIIAVKHAIEPLREAGITPWACILLDPRPHLMKFVENPDPNVLWFVASQVNPKVVRKLLDSGCTVWGYHASVGAEEGKLTEKQIGSIVSGGSATATRGLFLLEKMGFTRFRLYGYELSLPDKPDMTALDEYKQPKHFEMSVQAGGLSYQAKRAFWTEAQLIAQFEEFNQILQNRTSWSIKAFGHGMIPFVVRAKEVSDLREKAKKAKLGFSPPISYEELLGCRNKTRLLGKLPWKRPKILRKRKQESNS